MRYDTASSEPEKDQRGYYAVHSRHSDLPRQRALCWRWLPDPDSIAEPGMHKQAAFCNVEFLDNLSTNSATFTKHCFLTTVGCGSFRKFFLASPVDCTPLQDSVSQNAGCGQL
jgi:hypothetical protein